MKYHKSHLYQLHCSVDAGVKKYHLAARNADLWRSEVSKCRTASGDIIPIATVCLLNCCCGDCDDATKRIRRRRGGLQYKSATESRCFNF